MELSFVSDLVTQFLGSAVGAAGSAAIAKRISSNGSTSLGERERIALERSIQAWLEAERENIHIEVGDIQLIVAQSVNVIEAGDVSFIENAIGKCERPVEFDIGAVVAERSRRIDEARELRGGFEE